MATSLRQRRKSRAPRRRRGGGRRLLFGLRPAILFAILAALWPAADPALLEPIGFLATEPERVAQRFTRCGMERSHACVVDGDTFRLGQRRVRIIGIDAPEVKGRCPEERRLAAQATAKLQALLNQGPFTMTGRLDDMQDRYGRDLRALNRNRADGSVQSIAQDMRDSGLARRYLGYKADWCAG